MKFISNKTNGNHQIASSIRFPRLYLTTALMLTVMVILLFVWEFFESANSDYFNDGYLPVYRYSNFSFVLLASMLIIALITWLATVNKLHKSQKELISNDAARTRTEKTLRESEARFRLVTESASDAIITIDEDLIIIFVNSAAEIIFGHTINEMLGNNLAMLMPENKSVEYAAGIRRFGAKKKRSMFSQRIESTGLHKTGDEISIEVSLSKVTNDGKQLFTGIFRDITERKRVKEELQKNLSLLSSTFEATADGILVVDCENKIVTYNQQFIEMWQIPDEIIQSRDNEKAVNYVTKQLKNADEFIETTNYLTEKPKTRNFDILEFIDGKVFERYSHPQMLDGKVVGRVLSFRDITERQRAAETLRDSESILAAAQRITHLGSWELVLSDLENLHNNELRWSDETYRIFGFEPDEIKISNEIFYNLVHPDDRRRINQILIEAIEDRKIFNIEHRIILADKGERIIHGQAEIIFEKRSGKPLKMLGTVQDVTEQKRAETALRESEYKLRTLFDSMGEGLTQVNCDEVIEYVNERFCEMTGYQREELIGKSTLDMLFDEEGRKILSRENELRRDGISGQYEVRLRKKSGEMIWVSIGGAPIISTENLVTGTMGVFTDITERKRIEEQLLHDAFHDGLTGLANRALFSDHLRFRIERAKRDQNGIFAVLFLDFDRFKVVNDSLGHAEGDELLILIARRLEQALRSSDLVARLGGDEFTILLGELDTENDAIMIAERIQEDLKTPFEVGGSEIFMSASIGIALSTIGHTRAEDMLRDADIAMYCAKANGKACHKVFDQAMHDRALRQLQIETDIRQAFERGEFCLYYQPIFDIASNKLAGFEALIRWEHPERGVVSPDEFIPVAEENGLILPLGRWILYESCRQMREWQSKNPKAMNLKLSVNLSCKQFTQPDLVEQVTAALISTRLESHCLKLEITESHLMENSSLAVKTMNRLRELGVELSLDDFGTGYSSLSYLHRLPVNYLKIDRSFVSRMTETNENSEIVNTIIKLAQSLKMKVIAEGIETAAQLAQLKRLNCEFGQGYFYSRPLEAEAARLFINDVVETTSIHIDESIINLELNM